MKKMLIIALCLGIVPMLFAAATDTDATMSNQTEDHAFRVPNPRADIYDGPRSTPTLVDQISLSPINGTGYCWGLTYDWEMDVLWVSQWNSAYPKVFAIQKTSPCTKVDSFTLGGGAPSYHLGMGFAGSNTLYMAGYNSSIYEINMSTGAGTVFRTLPWSSAEGLGFNVVDDAVYPGDWGVDQCAWAQPAQSGSWNTWSLTSPSGLSGAYSTLSPNYLFTVDENASQAHFYQHSLSGGVPNTTPDSVWDCDPGQTQASTADCAFDGQYVYILDQSGPDMIWVYDVGITPQTTITWDFETGWQGWTHTNGAAFPAAWTVYDAYYKSGSGYQCPTPDDSSMWIDSDGAGSGYGWIGDTCLSPVLIPLASMDWLWYGWCYNDVGTGDWFEVGIKYYDGASWNVVPLATYTADNSGSYDSLDVSSYAGYSFVQVYFYYDDANSWAWYAAFDNVTIGAIVFVPSQDVGATVIVDPGTTIGPSMTINPTATYENFGTSTETFDVYFVIDSSGTNLYTETANITLASGNDTTIVWPTTWTSGPYDGIVYDVMAYTVFGPDVNPTNDTLAQQTIVSTVGNWIQCASLPTPEECSGTGYDAANQHIYSFGGTPDGGYNYHSYTYQYDPITDSWATMANMPYAVDWLDASYVNGHFYVFGGYDGTPHNYNMIYDVAGNVWSNGANMPIARMAGGQVVYNDSLIYMLGGYNGSGPSNDVQIYNVYTDGWTTGTALPQTNMMQGVAMTGDTIWLVGGYNGSAAYSTLYYGVINPSTCETIAWSTGSALPVPNFNNGATQLTRNNKWFLHIVGGFENAATITNHAWEYDVELDTWTALPDYPMTITRNDFLIGHEYRTEIYVCGGDPTGGWTATDQVWKLPWYTGVAEKPNQSESTFTFGFAAMANPSRGMISYTTPVSGRVVLKAYDGTGRLVETLVNAVQPAGTKIVNWDTNNIANGVYFLRLEAQGEVATHKMILVK
jgi:hypothetical protein